MNHISTPSTVSHLIREQFDPQLIQSLLLSALASTLTGRGSSSFFSIIRHVIFHFPSPAFITHQVTHFLKSTDGPRRHKIGALWDTKTDVYIHHQNRIE